MTTTSTNGLVREIFADARAMHARTIHARTIEHFDDGDISDAARLAAV